VPPAQAFAAEQGRARRGGLVVNTRVAFDAALLEEFARSHCSGLLPGSRHDYVAALSRALPYCGDKPLRALTPKLLEDFRDQEVERFAHGCGRSRHRRLPAPRHESKSCSRGWQPASAPAPRP